MNKASHLMRSRFGIAMVVEAVPTLLAAIAITFIGNHGPFIGFTVFVGYALFVAAALLMKAMLVPLVGFTRNLVIVQAVALAVSGAIAAMFLSADLNTLIVILSIWTAISAAIELYLAYRETDRGLTRDLLFMGGLSAIFAIIVSVIRMNDVYVVGLFGAYLAVRGVYEIIAGLSLRVKTESN